MRRERVYRSRWGVYRGKSGYEESDNLHRPGVRGAALVFFFFLVLAMKLKVDWLIGVGFVLAIAVLARGVMSAITLCEQRGYHNPFRPVDHLAEYKCWDCATELPELRGLSEARVQALLDDAIAQTRLRDHGEEAAQASYSNRR